MIDCHFVLQIKILIKNSAVNCESFFTNFKVQGTFLMWTVAGLNLPLIRCSEPLCHYCLFRYCRRKVLTSCVFFFLWFFFNSIFLGRESGVYCVPCWFWILEEGTQTETKLNCPAWFFSRWLQSGRNTTTTSRMQQDPDDHSSDSWFFFHAPCDLKERREAWWSLLLQEQDPEDLRCDFRLCSMLPVIWRKEESCSIVFPRTGSRRYLQVWFPTLFYFPRDLKERRDLVHRCSKNRSGKIFAGAISDFVKCSLWSEGK